MSHSIKNPVLALLAAAGLLLAAGTATAQGEAQQGASAPQQAESIDVSSEDVENFVDAYMAVQGINQEYTQKLQAVEDPEKATELQQQAQTEMQEAVSESGLSISEYQQIANQASQDEELRGQIEEALTARVEQ
ncbi:DUF4168 domain-containing protein [Marinimicrobium sp. C2-29]|uniref:DUF4168 domain-containing protein n=1 Tax=Marinimicrobium sp. C2-29 TaxID=3139825 RepID=UPI003139F868